MIPNRSHDETSPPKKKRERAPEESLAVPTVKRSAGRPRRLASRGGRPKKKATTPQPKAKERRKFQQEIEGGASKRGKRRWGKSERRGKEKARRKPRRLDAVVVSGKTKYSERNRHGGRLSREQARAKEGERKENPSGAKQVKTRSKKINSIAARILPKKGLPGRGETIRPARERNQKNISGELEERKTSTSRKRFREGEGSDYWGSAEKSSQRPRERGAPGNLQRIRSSHSTKPRK